MLILSLDLSTSTGWAVGDETGLLHDYDSFKVHVVDFNVNKQPHMSRNYPKNIVDAAKDVAEQVFELVRFHKPDVLVVEHTTKARNVFTQKILEYIHLSIWNENSNTTKLPWVYMFPAEWRSLLSMYMTKDDKKNNKLVNQGKKRGKITKKHLAVRMANEMYSLNLKQKNNDIADALLLLRAYVLREKNKYVETSKRDETAA